MAPLGRSVRLLLDMVIPNDWKMAANGPKTIIYMVENLFLTLPYL